MWYFKLPTEPHQPPKNFRRHVSDKHLWFSEMYLNTFDKNLPNNFDISQQDENDFSSKENIVDHEEAFEIEEDFDHFDDHFLPNVTGNILLELREHFNVTTKETCCIAEKMSQIIDSDPKLFSNVLRKSFVESGIREIGHQVNSLLKSDSRYSILVNILLVKSQILYRIRKSLLRPKNLF